MLNRALSKIKKSKMSPRIGLALVIGLMFVAGLACQTGNVVTPEEATATTRAARGVQRVTPILNRTEGSNKAEEEACADGPQVGDEARLTSKSFMVNLVGEPGAKRILAQQERGAKVKIIELGETGGECWYLVDAPTGQGWVKAENLKFDKATPEPAASGPKEGDTVYLTAKQYMVSLVPEPGAVRIIAQQERGTPVTIVSITEHEGELWYLIDAPTGEGWVSAENITTEPPE